MDTLSLDCSTSSLPNKVVRTLKEKILLLLHPVPLDAKRRTIADLKKSLIIFS